MYQKIRKYLTKEYRKFSTQGVFMKPAFTDAFPSNPFRLSFPENIMSPKEKIMYSLTIEGTQDVITLGMLTGFSSDDIKQQLEELIKEKRVVHERIAKVKNIEQEVFYSDARSPFFQTPIGALKRFLSSRIVT